MKNINMTYPLEGARATSLYGWRTDPITGVRSNHSGIDLAWMGEGDPVLPALPGTVKKILSNDTIWGNMIVLDHGNGLETYYAHLSKVYIKVGDQVVTRQQIGAVGSTGRSTGPHLHFTVKLNGQAVDPFPYLVNPYWPIEGRMGDKTFITIQHRGTGKTLIEARESHMATGDIVNWDPQKKRIDIEAVPKKTLQVINKMSSGF